MVEQDVFKVTPIRSSVMLNAETRWNGVSQRWSGERAKTPLEDAVSREMEGASKGFFRMGLLTAEEEKLIVGRWFLL